MQPYDDSQSRQLSSSIFDVDRDSIIVDVQKHFFRKEQPQIIQQGQRRKVIFGKMQQQKKSLYQQLYPHIIQMASSASSFTYTMISNGLWWVYSHLTNTIIPYTKQQLPKLIFVITKQKNNKILQSNGDFCVVQVQQDGLVQNQSQRQGQRKIKKTKIVIQLGQDNERDQALIRELQKESRIIVMHQDDSGSFPIGEDYDQREESFVMPSAVFSVVLDQAKMEVQEQNIMKQQQLKTKQQQMSQPQLQKKHSYQTPQQIPSHECSPPQPSQSLFTQKKIVYRLPKHLIFQLQQDDIGYNNILNKIQINTQVQSGYFVMTDQVMKSQSIQNYQQGQKDVEQSRQLVEGRENRIDRGNGRLDIRNYSAKNGENMGEQKYLQLN